MGLKLLFDCLDKSAASNIDLLVKSHVIKASYLNQQGLSKTTPAAVCIELSIMFLCIYYIYRFRTFLLVPKILDNLMKLNQVEKLGQKLILLQIRSVLNATVPTHRQQGQLARSDRNCPPLLSKVVHRLVRRVFVCTVSLDQAQGNRGSIRLPRKLSRCTWIRTTRRCACPSWTI